MSYSVIGKDLIELQKSHSLEQATEYLIVTVLKYFTQDAILNTSETYQ